MMHHSQITRRCFLQQTSVITAGVATFSAPLLSRAAPGPNDKVRVGIVGCNGRGMDHINGYLGVPNTEIAYICDVDSRAIDKGIAAVAKKQGTKPKGEKDF